jgi:hypothetical protein
MLVIVKREAALLVATEAVQEVLVRRPLAITEDRERERDAEHAAMLLRLG